MFKKQKLKASKLTLEMRVFFSFSFFELHFFLKINPHNIQTNELNKKKHIFKYTLLYIWFPHSFVFFFWEEGVFFFLLLFCTGLHAGI